MVVALSLKCYEVSVSVPQGSFLINDLFAMFCAKCIRKRLLRSPSLLFFSGLLSLFG